MRNSFRAMKGVIDFINMHLFMRGIFIFEKPCYREIRAKRGCIIRGLPVVTTLKL